MIVILFWTSELIEMQGWNGLPLFKHALHTAIAVCTVHLLVDACRAGRAGIAQACRWLKARVRVEIGWRVQMGEI